MSRILQDVRSNAKALADAGLMDTITLREIETLCLAPIKRYSSEDIRALAVVPGSAKRCLPACSMSSL